MEKLRNLAIRNKLILGFGIILVLMLGSTLLSFQSLNSVYSQVEVYRNETMPTTVRIWTIRRYNVSLQRYMALLSVSTNSQEKESYYTKIDSEQAGLNKEVAALELPPSTSEDIMIRMDDILKANDNYQTKLLELAKQSTPEAAEKARTILLKEYVPNAVQMGDVINDAAEAINSHVEAQNAEANRIKLRSTILLFGSLIMSIFLCGLIIRAITQSISKPAREIQAVYEEVANGNMGVQVAYTSKDELGQMANSIRTANTRLSSYIQDISEKLILLSQGNMCFTVELDYVGDFAAIKTALVDTAAVLNKTMSAISDSAEQVNSGSNQVSSAAQALASGATEQAATIEELNASVFSVTQQSEENLMSVQKAAEYVQQAGTGVEKSNQYMNKLNTAMKGIGETSQEISKITKLVEDIAFQTNILALNAAVEAARAGSAGKGFAVVAEEVRNLAAKSAEAAKQTEELIQKAVVSISEGEQLAIETVKLLENVSEKAQMVDKAIKEIETSTSGQAAAIGQINEGLSQVSSVVQTNAATAEESSASSEELAAQAQTLKDEVRKFKLDDAQLTSTYSLDKEAEKIPTARELDGHTNFSHEKKY